MSLALPFPSRTVAIYMGRLFLLRTFSVLAGIVLILQTLDLLGHTGDILAYAGNGEAEVWRYVGLRAPQIIAFALPFSVLLGTIVTLLTMNQNGEIIALRGLGLSAHQVLAPLLLASTGIAVSSFVFNDRIVTRATVALDQWQKVDYGTPPADRGVRTSVWVRDGSDLISVDRASGRGWTTAGLSSVFEEGWNRQRPEMDADVRQAGSGVQVACGGDNSAGAKLL